MKKINIYVLIILFTSMLFFQVDTLGREEGNGNKNKPSLSKTAADPAQSVININNITSWVGQDGFHDWVVASSWNGAFPKGAAVGAIFAEGIVWGGKVNDGTSPAVRVNGNTYGTGCAAITRVFRVRPDYVAGDLSSDAASFFDIALGNVTESDIQQIRDQYAKDWLEWPWEAGALYQDNDGDNVYDPAVDIPGIPGAAQTLFVKYDDSKSTANYGSPAIGLEVSETYWAYAYSGALGNVIYKKVDIFYKGTDASAANSTIDSMYIVQWADPDLGAAGDDFAGCDTTLNLGYTYNSSAVDATYESAGFVPPAVGYDFLQGVSQYTGNLADSAIYNLKWRKGYKYVNPKPMSSFAYFAAGGTWSDPGFDYDGTLEFYNLMRGKLPIPRYPSGQNFPESVADVTAFGTYLTDGDPVAGTGKLDGAVDTPGDRRLMVTNGPITMALGDTAQVVLAMVGAFGSDYLNSVTMLKQNDETAQIVFDQLFQLPSIDPPVVTVTPLEKEILLNWGTNPESVSKIENFEDKDYGFEGYLVYQLPNASSSVDDGILLANYDIINGVTAVYDTSSDKYGTSIPELVVPGTDNGLARYISITEDAVRGTPLRDGQAYYFAVIAYAYNPSPLLPFHALKSSAVTLVATPQQTDPGVRTEAIIGAANAAVHSEGGSDGAVEYVVIDPMKVTGHDYKVTFTKLDSLVVWDNINRVNNTMYDVVVWGVTDVTTGEVKISNQLNQNADSQSPIIDGIQFKVSGAPFDWKSFQVVANASGPLDPPEPGAFAFQGFPTPDDGNPTDRQQVGSGHWGFHTGDPGAVRGSYELFLERSMRGDNFSRVVPYDWEMRFTARGSWALRWFEDDFLVKVPFEIWNVGINTPDDPSDDYRLIPYFLSTTGGGGAAATDPNELTYQLDPVDHGGSGGANDPQTPWIYWTSPADETPGEAGYNDFLTKIDTTIVGAVGNVAYDAAGAHEIIARSVLVNWNGDDVSDGVVDPATQMVPEQGTVFRLISTKPNSTSDVFTLSAPGVSTNTDLAKDDVKKINVFPNPYYGTQLRETSRSQHYVTFNHLPSSAVIRIFDLSGVLVKTINHVSTSGQFDTWNLQNESGYPVASGIYIIYIDMPDLGTTKILKLAVVQEQQILQIY